MLGLNALSPFCGAVENPQSLGLRCPQLDCVFLTSVNKPSLEVLSQTCPEANPNYDPLEVYLEACLLGDPRSCQADTKY